MPSVKEPSDAKSVAPVGEQTHRNLQLVLNTTLIPELTHISGTSGADAD